jgi:16S rRNA (guanine527-N7)-methyltransferase
MSGNDAGPLPVDVSRETLERLHTYAWLLRQWNPRINLVSRATLDDLWSRHFVDSAQVFELAPDTARHWADLGSGGGFPGLVVAIIAAEKRPGLNVTLVESDKRKAVFLRTVAQRVGVDVTVIAERIESIKPLSADVLSARALAPLSTLLGFAERHMVPAGTALFLKGAGWRSEIKEALDHWRFRCEDITSTTSPDAAILKLGEIERV